jgi:hypothetical protein
LQSARQSDEVVEVFTGDTLEQAMAYAVATLGPDLTVRRARRVRKGVQGLRGKETYEVVAVPAPRAASGDAVGTAFDALLAQAEEAEDLAQPQPVRRTTRPAEPDLPPVVLEAVPELAPVTPAPEAIVFDQEMLAPAPTPTAAKPVAKPVAPKPLAAKPAAPRTRTTAPKSARTTAPARRPAVPAPRRTGSESGWGRTALKQLGLPTAVLAALPAKEPKDDLAWVAALAKAFATVLPEADPAAAVCVSGTGLDGVRGILAAGRKGMTPGTITYAGRTAPATAMELALCVRAEVLG